MTGKTLPYIGLLSQLQEALKDVIRPYVSLKDAIKLQKS